MLTLLAGLMLHNAPAAERAPPPCRGIAGCLPPGFERIDRRAPDAAPQGASTVSADFEELAQVRQLDFAALIRSAAGTPPPPATDAELAAACARLRMPLPEEIDRLYRSADGLPAQDIVPLAGVVRLADRRDLELASADPIEAWPHIASGVPGRDEPLLVPSDAAQRWLVLTPPGVAAVLYDAAPKPAVAGFRVYDLDSRTGLAAWPSLRVRIEAIHARQLRYDARVARLDAGIAAALPRLAGLAMPALLDEYARSQPALPWARTTPAPEPPPPPQVIADAERRIGMPLPDDLRALYAVRNGEAKLGIFPVEQMQVIDPVQHRSYLDPILAAGPIASYPRPSPDFPRTVDELGRCVIVGGPFGLEQGSPALLWCPSPAAPRRLLDLREHRVYSSLAEYVRRSVARSLAASSV